MGIKYSILGLLHYEDMHGYRIKEHLEKNFGHMWSVNYGQIYQALKGMEADGLIEMTGTAPSENGGPRRKLYAITLRGRGEFARWLAEPPERPMLLRDPFLTRFVFYGFGDRDIALSAIEGQIREYERQLERRKGNEPRWRGYGTYVRLLAELGVSFNEMYLEWLRKARGEIEAEYGMKTGTSQGEGHGL